MANTITTIKIEEKIILYLKTESNNMDNLS